MTGPRAARYRARVQGPVRIRMVCRRLVGREPGSIPGDFWDPQGVRI